MDRSHLHWLTVDRLLGFAALLLELFALAVVFGLGDPTTPFGLFMILAVAFTVLAMREGIRGTALGFALLWGTIGLAGDWL